MPAGDKRAAVAGYACQPALCSGNAATQASSTARSPGGVALAPRYGAYSDPALAVLAVLLITRK